VDGEVVLARKGLWTMVATILEFRIRLVRSLMTLETVAPLEGLAAVGAHVLAVGVVTLHVRGEVLLEPGGVLAKLALEDGVFGPFGLLSLRLFGLQRPV